MELLVVVVLTLAEMLTAALKACEKEHKHTRRVACEKRARAKYGPKHKKKGSKKTKSAKKAARPRKRGVR